MTTYLEVLVLIT